MDPMINMIVLDQLTKKEYTEKEWLTYYKNIWLRNTVARTIDVFTDKQEKANNKDLMVTDAETGRLIKIGERLEARKIAVEEGLNIIKGIDTIAASLVEGGKSFAEIYLSPEALKVEEDMIEKAAELVPEVKKEEGVVAPGNEAKVD